MNEKILLIVLSIIGVVLAVSVSMNFYLVVFTSVDAEELVSLRIENNTTKTELAKYLGLVESSKGDCDAKIAGAKKIWEANKDVKNDIDSSGGGMVTFEFGGVR